MIFIFTSPGTGTGSRLCVFGPIFRRFAAFSKTLCSLVALEDSTAAAFFGEQPQNNTTSQKLT